MRYLYSSWALLVPYEVQLDNNINYFPILLKFIVNTQPLEHNVTVAILSFQECTGHWSCRTSSSPQGICFHQQPEGLLNIGEGPTFLSSNWNWNGGSEL